jgi:hypothetical protein
MNSRLKLPKSYPLTLPLEYAPQLAGVTDEKHPKHYLIAGKVFASSEPAAVTTIVRIVSFILRVAFGPITALH